ncbi:hypothetical protein AVEN_88785-1 [Araneus ventricosus]|uniref:Uncharacterized protein n=1 Tax=Araneus ventricosus TaxID=182803 RepID=A0A4Y2SPI6_ARAVE|nr:hypothetical protein AVEN_88785-1 [Araneus ventricosus]
MAAKGIEMRIVTGDTDTYIVTCGLEEATSHSIVAITGPDVNLFVLLIALAPKESSIYFIKLEEIKVEAKLFCIRKLPKELSFTQTILLRHEFSDCDISSLIYRKTKQL